MCRARRHGRSHRSDCPGGPRHRLSGHEEALHSGAAMRSAVPTRFRQHLLGRSWLWPKRLPWNPARNQRQASGVVTGGWLSVQIRVPRAPSRVATGPTSGCPAGSTVWEAGKVVQRPLLVRSTPFPLILSGLRAVLPHPSPSAASCPEPATERRPRPGSVPGCAGP